MKEQELLEIIQDLGGNLYIVGGWVRDTFLGLNPKDKDYVVTGITVEDMPFDKIVGSDFPVFLVEVDGAVCEVALARSEKKIASGYHGFSFSTSPDITIEQDLARRDLTVNAMAMEVETGYIIDPFGGLTDLSLGILRHTTEAFAEDATRVLRVARFAARFKFSIAAETIDFMSDMRDELAAIKKERVWKELEKVLQTAELPYIFFDVLRDANVLDICFPEIAAMSSGQWHCTWLALGFETEINPIHRFGLLCYFMDVEQVIHFCERLGVPKEYRGFAVQLVMNRDSLENLHMIDAGELMLMVHNRLYMRGLYHVVRLMHLLDNDFWRNWQYGMRRIQTAESVIDRIRGHDLIYGGWKPGKELGQELFRRRVEAFRELDEIGS